MKTTSSHPVFVTETLRESVGRCSRVNDVVMFNMGIERMGTCSACGHDIKNHVGIALPDGTYMYVGSCCASVLCAPDKPVIAPDAGTIATVNGKEVVFISREQLKKLGDYIYSDVKVYDKFSCTFVYPNFDNEYWGANYSINHNTFLSNVYSYARESEKYNGKGCYTLSVKQFNCIKSIIEA